MAGLGSTRLSRLFLCLTVLFLPASSAESPDSCMTFSTVVSSSTAGIKADSDVYESNRVYTISVPVNNSTSSVALQALDSNSSNAVGLWYKVDQSCKSSVLYLVRDTREGVLKATWRAPQSMNITAVDIQAYAVDFHKVATHSSLKLKKYATTTTPSPSMISTTRQTTAQVPTTTQTLTTARIPKATPTPSTSLANSIFLSPITDALQILLVFLTSKLLF